MLLRPCNRAMGAMQILTTRIYSDFAVANYGKYLDAHARGAPLAGCQNSL